MLHSKAKQTLAQVATDAAKVVEAVEAMESGIALVTAIDQAAQLFQRLIAHMGSLLDQALDDLAELIESAGTNYQVYGSEQRHRVYLSVQLTQVLKLILETPLLTTEGLLHENCYRVIEQAEEFKQQLAAPDMQVAMVYE